MEERSGLQIRNRDALVIIFVIMLLGGTLGKLITLKIPRSDAIGPLPATSVAPPAAARADSSQLAGGSGSRPSDKEPRLQRSTKDSKPSPQVRGSGERKPKPARARPLRVERPASIAKAPIELSDVSSGLEIQQPTESIRPSPRLPGRVIRD